MPAPASPWDGFGTAREIVITEGLDDDPITGLFWLGAVVVGGGGGGRATTPSPNVSDWSRR